jgi:hypothetical protein
MNHFVDTDPRRCHRSTETSLSPGECFDDTEDRQAVLSERAVVKMQWHRPTILRRKIGERWAT